MARGALRRDRGAARRAVLLALLAVGCGLDATLSARPRIAVGEDEAAGRNWALRTDSGFVAQLPQPDAAAACASLGAAWTLPRGDAEFPALDPWPQWPEPVAVWLADGRVATVGPEGTAVGFAAAEPGAPDARAVLCVR
jgi:hypothetical protein